MAILNTELKSVPAINKQDLLLYIVETCPDTALNIATTAGHTYFCKALHIGTIRNETFLVAQLLDNRNNLLNRFLHLDVHRIESIELVGPEDAVRILSRGNYIKSKSYDTSGSLEVKRAFQQFEELVLSNTGINVGVPKMELPSDGHKLNRILKLTHIIQQVLIELLKQEDAAESWKDTFTGVAFVNSDYTEVKNNAGLAEISFPFENLNAPEVDPNQLMSLLMGVL